MTATLLAQLALSAWTIVGLWALVVSKLRGATLWMLVGEVLWGAYFLATDQPGTIPARIACVAVFAVGWRRWGRA